MGVSSQAHYLDLVPELRAPVVVHVSYGDTGQDIRFKILNNGEAYTFTGESAVVHGVRQDGANFGPFRCSTYGDTVVFPLQPSMTSVEGSAIAELSITSSTGIKIGTANFAIIVERAVFNSGVTYTNDVSVYEEILRYTQISDAQSRTSINNLRTETMTSINDVDSRSSAAVNNLQATVENEISTFEAAVNDRVDQIVSQAGSDNTEIVDARKTFQNVSKTNLKQRLNSFLEFDTVGSTDGVGQINDLGEEITQIVISWLNTHPANLVYASDGNVARYIIRYTADIADY